MRALLVYESVFGNTESVARAVAAGLGTVMHTDIHTVASAPAALPDDVGLLVVGAPVGLVTSHGRDLAHRAGLPARSGDVHMDDWLRKLRPATIPAASFGTSVHSPFPAAPTNPLGFRLHHLGMRLMRHEIFWTQDTLGPLAGRELDHARAWAEYLATEVAGSPRPAAPDVRCLTVAN